MSAVPPGAPGLAWSHAVPQPGLEKSYYYSDHERYSAAWHAAHCFVPDCERCQRFCDIGAVISCEECGRVHHSDWLGWCGEVDEEGCCTVWCPECYSTNTNNMEAKLKTSVAVIINPAESLYLMRWVLFEMQDKGMTDYGRNRKEEEFHLKIQDLIDKAVALALEKVNP